MNKCVELAQELVRIPSVNPMGRDSSGEIFLEFRVTEFLRQYFSALGVPTWENSIAPGRSNILARFEGSPDNPAVLVLEVHQDTVPVDGMVIDPFAGCVRDGRLYGRGACDIKGAMACMLTAFSRMVSECPPRCPTVIMACSVNEEYGFTGAQALTQAWPSDFLARAPDAVIVAEPTELDVVVAHKGVVRWNLHTSGTAVHSSQPHLGDSAIFRMGRVLQALERYAAEIVSGLASHPLVGNPTLSVGTVVGGISVNTVPDHCSIEIDRRVVPGEDPEAAWNHVRNYLAETLGVDEGRSIEHEPPYIRSGGLADVANQELADWMLSRLGERSVKSVRRGVPYGTDAPAFSEQGIPTVVFGPGCIDQAHTRDEWVAVDQLEQAAELYYQLATDFSLVRD